MPARDLAFADLLEKLAGGIREARAQPARPNEQIIVAIA
jgi:hypothetical protein